MKAIEILEKCKILHKLFDDTQIQEAIEELEEMMKPKTCDGCVHKPNPGENYYDPCNACKRWYGDRYETTLWD